LAAVLLWRGDQPAALDEAGKLLANVNPELPQPLPPAVPPFVVELFKTDVELHRAVYRALRGEDLEEQKRIVRSHFDKEPRPEKLPEVAQAFGLEVPAARINKEWLRATANVQAPTLLLPGMARHLHEQRGVPLDPAKEVARLHRQLRDTPDDALVLAKLGGVHAELGQPGEAVKNYALAKQRLEALLAGDGGNTFLQAHYVIALSTVGDNDRADRGFLKLAGENSADWRVWRCLGDYAFMRGACLLGFAMGANGQEGAWRRIENPALIQPATPADLAERWLDCAELCNAKAAHLAPRESDVWLADAFFANRGSNLRNLIRMARGQAPDPKIAEAAAARAQACLRHVCRLAPDCPYYVSVYAQAATTAKPVSVETLKEIETCLAQLDQMARTKDRDTAGHCHMNAAICRLLLDHPKQALEHARKALALLPDDEIAWNTVAALLNHEMDTVECRKLLVRKAERFPSALNHLYAAALYCNELELDAAEEHLRAGLKLAENDLNCTLAMAAIALTRGDAPEHLAQAERWLHKAGAILGEQSHPQHLFLTGVLHGLRGETLLCQAYLRQAQALDPSNQFIKHALLAVNP
jgi:tetratricopeptide (TPR) repeat protein